MRIVMRIKVIVVVLFILGVRYFWIVWNGGRDEQSQAKATIGKKARGTLKWFTSDRTKVIFITTIERIVRIVRAMVLLSLCLKSVITR